MSERETTLRVKTDPLEGNGLHDGAESRVTFGPSAPGSGVVFRRADLPGSPVIPARIEHVESSERCTVLAFGDARIRTVEHALAACVLAGVDNALIDVEGEELPAGDGSALPYLERIEHAGLVLQDRRRLVRRLPCTVERSQAAGWSIRAAPAGRPAFRFVFRGGGALSGREAAFVPGRDDGRALAAARTFCFDREVAELKRRGLGKGGHEGNVLVLRDDGTSLNAARMPDEPVWHKLLDLIGDLSLLGGPVAAEITAEGSGHAVHAAFARALVSRLSADKEVARGA